MAKSYEKKKKLKREISKENNSICTSKKLKVSYNSL